MTVAGTFTATAVVAVAIGCAAALLVGFGVTLGFSAGLPSGWLLMEALDRCFPARPQDSTRIVTAVERMGGRP